MSTKALELLVWGFEKVPHGESMLPGLKCLHCVVEEAKKELEAMQTAQGYVFPTPEAEG